jgi:hypothetical protein
VVGAVAVAVAKEHFSGLLVSAGHSSSTLPSIVEAAAVVVVAVVFRGALFAAHSSKVMEAAVVVAVAVVFRGAVFAAHSSKVLEAAAVVVVVVEAVVHDARMYWNVVERVEGLAVAVAEAAAYAKLSPQHPSLLHVNRDTAIATY